MRRDVTLASETPQLFPKASLLRTTSWMSCSSASDEMMPKANMEGVNDRFLNRYVSPHRGQQRLPTAEGNPSVGKETQIFDTSLNIRDKTSCSQSKRKTRSCTATSWQRTHFIFWLRCEVELQARLRPKGLDRGKLHSFLTSTLRCR